MNTRSSQRNTIHNAPHSHRKPIINHRLSVDDPFAATTFHERVFLSPTLPLHHRDGLHTGHINDLPGRVNARLGGLSVGKCIDHWCIQAKRAIKDVNEKDR
jgi:hypothetical protein